MGGGWGVECWFAVCEGEVGVILGLCCGCYAGEVVELVGWLWGSSVRMSYDPRTGVRQLYGARSYQTALVFERLTAEHP